MLFDWIWVSEPDGLREEDSQFLPGGSKLKRQLHTYIM